MTSSDRLPSASGARLAGDDYQHVLTWIHALKLLVADSEVTRIEFEADDAGNVDDLIVFRKDAPPIYHQIKFVVSQAKPLTHKWFTSTARGRQTPLQRFHESFTNLSSEPWGPPEMVLYTNRLPGHADPILRHVSGTDHKLVPRLAGGGPTSASGKARKEWADHLGIDEDELLRFLAYLGIRPVSNALADLEEQCGWAMRAVGFRADVSAVLAVVGTIRKLIRTGVRTLEADGVRNLAEQLSLRAGNPRATLLVQSLAPDPWPETATASVDWVELFEGDEPRARRQLRDVRGWNDRLKVELEEAVAKIRRAGLTEVDVRGTMRLPTGLLVGQQLSEVAGFTVAIRGRDGEWSSAMPRHPGEIEREEVQIGQGQDLATALSVSQAIRGDVLAYIEEHSLPVRTLIVYSPAEGPSRSSVASPAVGMGLAAGISEAMRKDTSRHEGRLHLFQAAPLPLAVMVGHLWNRMPITQLYEDLGPGAGYGAAYTI